MKDTIQSISTIYHKKSKNSNTKVCILSDSVDQLLPKRVWKFVFVIVIVFVYLYSSSLCWPTFSSKVRSPEFLPLSVSFLTIPSCTTHKFRIVHRGTGWLFVHRVTGWFFLSGFPVCSGAEMKTDQQVNQRVSARDAFRWTPRFNRFHVISCQYQSKLMKWGRGAFVISVKQLSMIYQSGTDLMIS